MREVWPSRKIDEIKASINGAIGIGPFGSRMKSNRYTPSGIPVIRGNNISDTRALVGDLVFVSPETADELRSSNVFPGDLFFPHRGLIGEVGIVPSDGPDRYVLSSSLMKLTCNRDIVDPSFLFYFFRSSQGRHELLKYASTVGTPGIGQPLTSLRSMTVPVPPIHEQRAIAKVLGMLDDKIDLNGKISKTLDAMRQAIFKHWFVDFEFPNEQGKPYKSSGGQMVHYEELGTEIPRDWKVGKLEEFIDLDKGLSYKGKFLSNKGIPLINLGTIAPRAGFIDEGLKHYTGEYKERQLVRAGDIVIANTDITQKREVLGSPAIVPPYLESETALFTHHIFAVRNKSRLPASFIYFLLQTPQYRDRVRGFATGTTVLALPKDAILELGFVVPDDEILKRFDSICSALFQRANSLINQKRCLVQIRDSLLPKLMSGRIRVPVEVR